MSKDTELVAGVIGLGVGAQHIAGYEHHPGCTVKSLCDIDAGVCQRLRDKYPGKCVTQNPADVLCDPEIRIVSIASYDDAHFEQIMLALENGKHVFVEKPLCLCPEQARAVRKAMREHPELKLSSNLILRRCPRFLRLRTEIQAGRFGELYYLEGDYDYGRLHKITKGWRGKIDFYSVVYGGAVHMIDLLLWLTGDVPVEVIGYANNIASRGTNYKYHDFAVALLRFENGMVAKVSANYGCVRPHFHRLAVYGTSATFCNEPDRGLLYGAREPESEPEQLTEPYPGYHKGDLIHSFVRSILEEDEADVTTDDAFNTMSVCFAMEEAVRDGKQVSIDYV